MVSTTVAGMDISALTWVQGEIEQSLTRGLESLAVFRQTPDDQASLQRARAHFRQAVGAIQMVGLDALAVYAAEIELQLERLGTLPKESVSPVATCIESASKKLQVFLAELARGAPLSPLILFGEYEAMQKLREVKYCNPVDLFFPDLSPRIPDDGPQVAVTSAGLPEFLTARRRTFQRGLLDWMRGNTDAGVERMARAVNGIYEATPQQGIRTFWITMLALFDMLQAGALSPSFGLQFLLARVDLQIRRLSEGGGNVAERLRREALYFVAMTDKPVSGRVAKVYRFFHLATLLPKSDVNGTNLLSVYATVREMKTHVNALKTIWARVIAGQSDQFPKLREELLFLFKQSSHSPYPEMQLLFGVLGKGCEALNPSSVSETIGMEYATALLFAEDVFAQYGNPVPDLTQQIAAIRARVEAAIKGQKLPGFDLPRLHEISQQAEDKVLLPQLAAGIQTNLRHMEQELDAFFRDNTKRETLDSLARDGQEISGALRVLGRDDADRLLQMCLAQIESYTRPETMLLTEDFELLAESLSALGFYIEALQQQREPNTNLIAPLIQRYRVRNGLPPEDDTPPPGGGGEPGGSGASEGGTSGSGKTGAKAHAGKSAGGARAEQEFSPLAQLGTPELSPTPEEEAVADTVADVPVVAETVPPRGAEEQATMVEEPVEAEAIPVLEGQVDFEDEDIVADLINEPTSPQSVEKVIQGSIDELVEMSRELQKNLANTDLIVLITKKVQLLGDDAKLISDGQLLDKVSTIKKALSSDRRELLAGLIAQLVVAPKAVAPSAEAQRLLHIDAKALDAELLDIFLEEASDVLDSVEENRSRLKADPDDIETIRAVRRAFHTLKGSGRMVGLTDLGELAWEVEKIHNQLLEGSYPASEKVQHMMAVAEHSFRQWIAALVRHKEVTPDPRELMAAIESVAGDLTPKMTLAELLAVQPVSRIAGYPEITAVPAAPASATPAAKTPDEDMAFPILIAPETDRDLSSAALDYLDQMGHQEAMYQRPETQNQQQEAEERISSSELPASTTSKVKATPEELLQDGAFTLEVQPSAARIFDNIQTRLERLGVDAETGPVTELPLSEAPLGNTVIPPDALDLVQSPVLPLKTGTGEIIRGKASAESKGGPTPDDNLLSFAVPLRDAPAVIVPPASPKISNNEIRMSVPLGAPLPGQPVPGAISKVVPLIPTADSLLREFDADVINLEVPLRTSRPASPAHNFVDTDQITLTVPLTPEADLPAPEQSRPVLPTAPVPAVNAVAEARITPTPAEPESPIRRPSSARRSVVDEAKGVTFIEVMKQEKPSARAEDEDVFEDDRFQFTLPTQHAKKKKKPRPQPLQPTSSVATIGGAVDAVTPASAKETFSRKAALREARSGVTDKIRFSVPLTDLHAEPVAAMEEASAHISDDEFSLPIVSASAAARSGLITINIEDDALDDGMVPEVQDAQPEVAHAEASTPPVEASTPPASANVYIGDIVLSKTLFDLFTAEAAQHWLILTQELTLMQMDDSLPPSEAMIRATHTLAGIHGTTGFKEVFAVAKALENLLTAAAERKEAGLPPVTRMLPVIARSVAGLRALMDRILAQEPFAPAEVREGEEIVADIESLLNGEMTQTLPEDADAATLNALATHAPPVREAPVALEGELAAFGNESVEAGSEEAFDQDVEALAARLRELSGVEPIEALPVDGVAFEEDADIVPEASADEFIVPEEEAGSVETPTETPVETLVETPTETPTETPAEMPAEIPAETPVAASSSALPDIAALSDKEVREMLVAKHRPAPGAGDKKKASAVTGLADEIDPQLLPIFLDESIELLQNADENLHLWAKNAADADAALKLKRSLHTLKGSARMVGAMRLGDLAHKMETHLLEAEQPTSADVEGLFTEYDHINYVIRKMRAGDLDVVFPWEQAPEPQPIEQAAEQQPAEQPSVGQQPEAPMPTEPQAPQPSAAVPPEEEAAIRIARERARREATTKPNNTVSKPQQVDEGALLRVSSNKVDRLVNETGEIIITRTRAEGELRELKNDLLELTNSVLRLRQHLRTIEIEAESRIQAQLEHMQDMHGNFDPLEFDRFTQLQETTRSLAEGVNDVSTIQQTMLSHLDSVNLALLMQSRMSRDVQQTLFAIRTVPFASVSERLFRIMRSLTKELNKQANLEILGGHYEIDRAILERLIVPLEHLLRNSLDHGVESPKDRVAAGKAERADITINVSHVSGEIVVAFSDDGRGINRERLREKARARGEDPDNYNDAALVNMVFDAGVSTAKKVTAISGRGIGLDIVRNEVLSLGGRIEVDSQEGKGTTFTLYLPLTVSIVQAMLVRGAQGRAWAINASLVEQVEHVNEGTLARMYQTGKAELRGKVYPFYYFDWLLGIRDSAPEPHRYNSVAFLKSGNEYVAIHIDQVIGNQEIVIKSAGTQLLRRIHGLVGATILGTGEIVLIVNPAHLVQRYSLAEKLQKLQKGSAPAARVATVSSPSVSSPSVSPPSVSSPGVPPQEAVSIRSVLVVDDSLTVRKVTSRLLTREGFAVETAKDGFDALKAVSEHRPDIILLDIEMPKMDGFEFAKLIKGDNALSGIPIIMITSRTADKHRERAKEIGVNGYLGKPYQEDELLEYLQTLLNDPTRKLL